MNTENLSDRLKAVVQYIPAGSRLADIGSDHAYLPCHAVQQGIVTFAVAGEVAEGPYRSAKKQVDEEGLSDNIFVRKGDGLDVISPGEVDCITIAGMGGTLIASILEKGKQKLPAVKRLILQPNIGAISIRKWLMEHDWKLVDEKILEEDGKIYEILAAEQGDPRSYYGESFEGGLLLGPILMSKQNDVFRKKWISERDNWERILIQLEKADENRETSKKKQELLEKIRIVEGVLKK
ncbi:tRNA (adenine(22)-N(1))-methyltransferase TrmK [Bacillus canaveralius]|uniref:tRNA (Adenine(22)-N(1))-methyltransferase TrmK n=1 Tax=Bacillus canaveralius TaxID=1403243 RepID=A0A2N5GR70_9BACI|nr:MULTISPECIES: tRNA (adenine(22)-N(1))-methyltransferase TrmK [Bacillus]PLR85920.1 tRNA (adenine(22)-N(1))-methyltransferase TrmK [Bacillus canaveralius]PLR87618.1 tRNA (adenine(22)-N(1))-methyltransferase TrmK [Bacillus sp. V33-4]PLS00039.1 tRNA (adenine(22)-N(1))-methyltransferase TrmK [Bacillus canaveralius]RSK56224.1 tRNA (adenine-N(1))-methyltransferase [Bacillus canaveralius]